MVAVEQAALPGSRRAQGRRTQRRSGSPGRIRWVINAMIDITLPTLVDVGANAALSMLTLFDEELIAAFTESQIELGLLVIVAADASAMTNATKRGEAPLGV
jgi:hypothetical protein